MLHIRQAVWLDPVILASVCQFCMRYETDGQSIVMPSGPETLPFIFSINTSRFLSLQFPHLQGLVFSFINISFVHFASTYFTDIVLCYCSILHPSCDFKGSTCSIFPLFVCICVLGRWWSVTSQSPRLYIAHSVGWRPITLPYLKWVQSSSTSRNTLQRCTAWWSAAPTSYQNRFQTSSVSPPTCEANLCTFFS